MKYEIYKGDLDIKGGVTSFVVNGADAEIKGTCAIKDVGACTYILNVQDNGKGKEGNDRFVIRVYNPDGTLRYQQGGLLTSGDIHIHKKK